MSDPEPTHPNDVQFRPPSPHPFPSEASVKLDTFLGHAIADLSQPGKIPPMSAPSPTGFVPGEISGMFRALRARKDAMVKDIMSNGAELETVLSAGEQISAQMKAEGEAMRAEFGLSTNGPPT